MAIGLAAVGLLAFLLGCSGIFDGLKNSKRADKCFLAGKWVAENGAKIVISENNNGVFSGFYLTPVRATDNTKIPPIMLQGIQHVEPQPTFAFILRSKTYASTSVFVGQCFLGENREEQLKTTWLVRVKVESTAKEWNATTIGTRTFERIK